MKTNFSLRIMIFSAVLILVLLGCAKDDLSQNANGLLKKVKNGGYITEEISYNEFNLISELNGTQFWRKYYYNDQKQLIKEEIAINPNSLSSSMPSNPTYEFVDPNKVGISMYHLFEYDDKGLLIRQLNYLPKDGPDELRSSNSFEYNSNNLISKELLMNSDAEVTQFRTYQYDLNGNVIEENYYSYLFIPEGTGPKHLSKTTFEFDSYLNPYKIFEKANRPGLFSNLNNIIKSTTINYDPVPGLPATTTSQTSYEYNEKTRYPIRVINGEEFIYE
jgi:hypothetical protein